MTRRRWSKVRSRARSSGLFDSCGTPRPGAAKSAGLDRSFPSPAKIQADSAVPGCQIRLAEKISLFKEVKATKREIADGRRRDRFHRTHADRQGLSRRLQHDARRRAR